MSDDANPTELNARNSAGIDWDALGVSKVLSAEQAVAEAAQRTVEEGKLHIAYYSAVSGWGSISARQHEALVRQAARVDHGAPEVDSLEYNPRTGEYETGV